MQKQFTQWSMVVALMIGALLNAQEEKGRVGVNIKTPRATLEVQAGEENLTETATTNEGVILPHITKLRLAKIADAKLVEGTIVYIDNISYTESPANPKVVKVTEKGYYLYDGSLWQKLGGGGKPTGLERLTETNTNGKPQTGWRLIGRDPNDYGTIGAEAVDLSYTDNDSGSSPSNEGATGRSSVAMGYSTRAKGYGSTAMGTSTQALGRSSTAMGDGSIAEADGSIAMGGNTRAKGNSSVAMGFFCKTLGQFSIAMGNSSVAEQWASIAMGNGVTARGAGATAMGSGTLAEADASTAIGDSAKATGGASVAMGLDVTALGEASIAMGRYNYESEKNLVSVGSGYKEEGDDEFSDGITIIRKNAFVIDYNGNVAIGKDETAGSGAPKLEVNGDVKANTFRASNGSVFPDYVFQQYYTGTSILKAEYNFRGLNQVEDFVKTHGHLPGYQSAKEVKEQGYIDIVDTQLTNVEKIEELYLHSIEQEKAIKAKDAEIKELKTELAAQKARLDKLEKLLIQ